MWDSLTLLLLLVVKLLLEKKFLVDLHLVVLAPSDVCSKQGLAAEFLANSSAPEYMRNFVGENISPLHFANSLKQNRDDCSSRSNMSIPTLRRAKRAG